MYVIFDTETTGLPKNWSAPITDSDNWPRIIQFAFIVCAEDGTAVIERSSLIYPEGWEVPESDFHKQHGYTTEKCKEDGVPLMGIVNQMLLELESSSTIVAHNINFDMKVLRAELYRTGYEVTGWPKQVCTMQSSTKYCRIPGARGGFKWPKLEELHQILFGEKFEGAHDALADVKATARCFFELKRLGVIR